MAANDKIKLLPPPSFTEEKLKQILHYTDIEDNPIYLSFKSKAIFELHSGAKGVSKSFGRMIVSVYRLVNDNRFNSIWCRNIYTHITTTLVPLLRKVLDFLAQFHNLDYTPYFYITNSAAYWQWDDGGMGRAIFFANWQNVQSFQGITLQKYNFLFGELVIDEPIEDISSTKLSPNELENLYQVQLEQLPIIANATVFRTNAEKDSDFPLRITFLYNIFTTEHFLIKEFHNPILEIKTKTGKINQENLDKLIEKTYLQKQDLTFDSGNGIIITMYSKFFIPKKEISTTQLNFLNGLKTKNYRMWVITVAGFAFEEKNNKLDYFLIPYIFDSDGNFKNKIEFLSKNDFKEKFINDEVIAVFDGFDAGKSDKSSWVRVALLKNGKLVVVKIIEDLKMFVRENSRELINQKLVDFINYENDIIENWLKNHFITSEFFKELNSVVLTDNDFVVEGLSQKFQNTTKRVKVKMANRRDTKKEKFGIINRQNYQKWLFENNLISFMPKTKNLLKRLAKQVISSEDKNKRDEKINREIYDLINAFEMACSFLYKTQIAIVRDRGNNGFR